MDYILGAMEVYLLCVKPRGREDSVGGPGSGKAAFPAVPKVLEGSVVAKDALWSLWRALF